MRVTSVIFKPLPKVPKQSPIGRIFAQSGHPDAQLVFLVKIFDVVLDLSVHTKIEPFSIKNGQFFSAKIYRHRENL
jgi:hypothetical protein